MARGARRAVAILLGLVAVAWGSFTALLVWEYATDALGSESSVASGDPIAAVGVFVVLLAACVVTWVGPRRRH